MTHQLWLDPLGLHSFKSIPQEPPSTSAPAKSSAADKMPTTSKASGKTDAASTGGKDGNAAANSMSIYGFQFPPVSGAHTGFNFNFYCAALVPGEDKTKDAQSKPKT